MIIQPPLRQQVLEKLHEGHPGMTRMKAQLGLMCGGPSLMKILSDVLGLACHARILDRVRQFPRFKVWHWGQNPWQPTLGANEAKMCNCLIFRGRVGPNAQLTASMQ